MCPRKQFYWIIAIIIIIIFFLILLMFSSPLRCTSNTCSFSPPLRCEVYDMVNESTLRLFIGNYFPNERLYINSLRTNDCGNFDYSPPLKSDYEQVILLNLNCSFNLKKSRKIYQVLYINYTQSSTNYSYISTGHLAFRPSFQLNQNNLLNFIGKIISYIIPSRRC